MIEDILGDISGNDLSGKAETPLSNKHESCQKELSQIKELLTNLFHKMDTGNINKTFTVMELMPKDDVTMELKSHNIVFPLETPNDLQNLEHQMKTNSRVSALVVRTSFGKVSDMLPKSSMFYVFVIWCNY